MTLRAFVVVLALMVPSAAMADPITASGLWSPTMTPPSADPNVLPLEATAFWSNWSWDGPLMGVAYLINAYHTENLEYLHNPDGSRREFPIRRRDHQSDDFSLASRRGLPGSSGETKSAPLRMTTESAAPNSWDNGEQFALFRIVGPETTRYFLGVEDIPVSCVVLRHATTTTTSRPSRPSRCPSPARFCFWAQAWRCSRPGGGARLARRAARRRTRRQTSWMDGERGPAQRAGPFCLYCA